MDKCYYEITRTDDSAALQDGVDQCLKCKFGGSGTLPGLKVPESQITQSHSHQAYNLITKLCICDTAQILSCLQLPRH